MYNSRLLEDLKLNSTDFLGMPVFFGVIIALENEFNIEIPDDYFDKWITVQSIFDYLCGAIWY
jgi:acyl carrier protein